MNAVRGLAASVALLAGQASEAGQPFFTDDARIVDAKACQLETWTRHTGDAAELWAMPACNPTGNLELGFGGGRTRENGASRFSDAVLQGKTLLRPLAGEDWGVGLVAGMARRAARESANGWPGDPYLYVPVSVALLPNEAWVAHVNAGVIHQRDTGRTLGIWGLASEARLAAEVLLLAEVFRNEVGRPFVQAGFRYGIVPGRLQLDATVGDRSSLAGSERWFALGLRVLTPRFLP